MDIHLGKVHGGLARAGKVRGATPKVSKLIFGAKTMVCLFVLVEVTGGPNQVQFFPLWLPTLCEK